MRIQEARALSDEELARELANSRREMMNLRFRHATKQLNNTSQLNTTRRSIARLKTMVQERKLQKAGS